MTIQVVFFKVGMTRFELAASSSRTKRATGLRYIPNRLRCKITYFFDMVCKLSSSFFFPLKN